MADLADIFRLEKGDLLALPRFAEKSVDKLLAAIEARRKIDLARFLVALSIDNVGEEIALDLVEHFGSLTKIRSVGLTELAAIPGVGEVVAKSIYDWFRSTTNKNLLERLLQEVKIIRTETTTSSSKLKGQIFVLTGTLATWSREDAKNIIRQNGGEVSSSVSKQTSYVLAGVEPGSKYQEAQKLGVKIIDEVEFQRLIA